MMSQDSIDNKYTIIEKKGFGISSNVYLVKENNTKKNYAAKVLLVPSTLFDKEIEILNTLKQINNQYIVNLKESGTGQIIISNESETKQYLILEYVPKGELFKYLFFPNKGFGEKYSKIIFSKILKGIQVCHNAGICHRDIKMQNILVDEHFNPKICDFGYSTFNEVNLKDFCGTLNFAAPEILNSIQYDGCKADIFSLGVVLMNLVTCKKGFLKATKDDPFYRLIITKHYKQYWNSIENQIQDVSEEFKNLYIKMISFRPKERPTIEEILNDEWMHEIKDLSKEEYEELENKIREDFLEREKIINEKTKKKMKTNGQMNNNIEASRGIDNDEKQYFDSNLKVKYTSTGLEMNNYIKINGKLNPIQFMATLANRVQGDLGDIEECKDELKFDIIFEEEEKKQKELDNNKELEEELEKLGIENNINEENEIMKKDCIMEVSLFESINGGYLLRFIKKSGEIEDYYKNLVKITDVVEHLL